MEVVGCGRGFVGASNVQDAAGALVVAGPVSDEMIVVLVPVSASSFADAGVADMPRTATVYPYCGHWMR